MESLINVLNFISSSSYMKISRAIQITHVQFVELMELSNLKLFPSDGMVLLRSLQPGWMSRLKMLYTMQTNKKRSMDFNMPHCKSPGL